MEKLENNNGDVQLQALIKYGSDLSKMAFQGKLDPVIGREKEIQRVIQILCKRTKNNACLIGEPGVGKTVIAEGLAILISNNVVPSRLTGKKIFALEMGRLVAGTTYRGDFEGRLTEIVGEVMQSNGNIILFIDELHTLIGAGHGSGALDAANILKPALARGQVKCIGATTLEEYKKYIENDAALKRRFIAVHVTEPCVDEAIQILKGVQNKYEVFHNVKYDEEAIIACVDLSKKYIPDQFLPDKAIDLIDEAGSRVQVLQAGKPEATQTVTKSDVGNVISSMTGIPLEQICGEHDEDSAKRLLSLEETLSKHVIDQDEAVSVISRAIRRVQVGLRDPQRPVATFLFTGPTGVGKTETAKVLAREYYGSTKDDKSMIRLDMSEYMESHSISKLIGSPPGYVGYNEGGQLTEAIHSKPHSLVLFDEIEKAHPQIFNALLQILDDGRLTDGKGRTVNFNNTIIIMTSNVVTNEDEAVEKLRKTFKPEFLNRLDEIVVFKKVSNKTKKKILDVMLSKVVERIKVTNKLEIEVAESFKKKLLEESGSTNTYGARPLKRAITRLLEDSLAESILKESIKKGDSVIVGTRLNGEVIIHRE